ncbi:MAG: sigma-70 family RNA polymerase sigma factor [Myxococcota bacterium]|nr:sigma-70 family RNA polymerase sigma factor [Myxococcota bacterium]
MLLALLGMALGPTDDELVRRFREGEVSAYSDLVMRYQDRVYGQCLRWMGNPRIAEEVAQDVFLAIYRALPRFRGESRVSTWIFRITVNHCKNRKLYRNRRKFEAHEPLEGIPRDDDGPSRQIPSQGPGTDQGSHRSEAEEILNEALSRLDEDQRTIILLRDIQDLSYEEISEILDLPRGTVKSRLHRARAELTKLVSRNIGTEDIFE